MVLLDMPYTLYFLKKNNHQLRAVSIHIKRDKMTVSELMGTMEEAGESPKKSLRKKKSLLSKTHG